jgi:hypothetical protein
MQTLNNSIVEYLTRDREPLCMISVPVTIGTGTVVTAKEGYQLQLQVKLEESLADNDSLIIIIGKGGAISIKVTAGANNRLYNFESEADLTAKKILNCSCQITVITDYPLMAADNWLPAQKFSYTEALRSYLELNERNNPKNVVVGAIVAIQQAVADWQSLLSSDEPLPNNLTQKEGEAEYQIWQKWSEDVKPLIDDATKLELSIPVDPDYYSSAIRQCKIDMIAASLGLTASNARPLGLLESDHIDKIWEPILDALSQKKEELKTTTEEETEPEPKPEAPSTKSPKKSTTLPK